MKKRILIIAALLTGKIYGAEEKIDYNPRRRNSFVKRDIGVMSPEEALFYDQYHSIFRTGYKLYIQETVIDQQGNVVGTREVHRPVAVENLEKRAEEEGISAEFVKRMKELYADRLRKINSR